MRALVATLLVALAGLPAAAHGAVVWKVRGGGYGHGVGMSQYGAYGYAQHGWTYDEILAHYYTGTALGSVNAALKVRVLIDTEPNSVAFSGATRAGSRPLVESATYTIRRARYGRVALYRGARWLQRFGAGVSIRGGESVRLREKVNGLYRGVLRVERDGSRLAAINRLGLDNYVKGVVSNEMPASWHPEALKVQAVAARTYAVTSGAGVSLLYSDTRSQVFRGMSGESDTGNAAVTATRGRVVTYGGRPVTTFYFSTSGGRTENVENVFCPTAPDSCRQPYLRGVVDRYDDISSLHTWTRRYSPGSVGGKLGVGTLKRYALVKRGFSPRIVFGRFTGTAATRTLTGSQLRSRLGLPDAPYDFKRIESNAARAASAAATMRGAAGAAAAPSRVTARPHERLVGSVAPARRGTRVRIERRTSGAWVAVDRTRLRRGGRFAWTPVHAGRYRIAVDGLAGPAVRLR